jgi:outer membrane protein assembly factor BamE (lipoprotein component of BamABCDE complex)
LNLLLDSVLRYSVPEMKTSILSALMAAALALCATAQDCNHQIALGMTFADVAATLGQPVNHWVSNDGATEQWYYLAHNPFSVSNEGVTLYVPYSCIVEFDTTGRVSTFTQIGCH